MSRLKPGHLGLDHWLELIFLEAVSMRSSGKSGRRPKIYASTNVSQLWSFILSKDFKNFSILSVRNAAIINSPDETHAMQCKF